jgi:hypothetical protein
MRPVTYSGPASRARYWRKLYRAAGPELQRAGRLWYPEARSWLAYQARTYSVGLEPVAAVVAVLSPRIAWERNLAAAAAILGAVLCGTDPGPVPGFARNASKAYSVVDAALEGRPFLHYVRGPKVTQFYAALLGRPAVVLDAHMMRAARVPERQAERALVYRAIADAIQRAAALEHVRPEGLQAAIWLHIRNGGPAS